MPTEQKKVVKEVLEFPTFALELISSHLSFDDLMSFCLVSRRYEDAVLHNVRTNQRIVYKLRPAELTAEDLKCLLIRARSPSRPIRNMDLFNRSGEDYYEVRSLLRTHGPSLHVFHYTGWIHNYFG